MATAPKAPRPTPGVGDTNTPEQVAQVNKAEAEALAGQTPEAPAPAAAPASSASSPRGPQAAPGAGPAPLDPGPGLPPAENLNDHLPDSQLADSALYGPTDRPGEDIMTGTTPQVPGRPRVTPAAYAAIKAAAQDPAAPPEILNLFNLLNYHLTKD